MNIDTPAIITIGNFDGLHLGHRRLIDATIALARSCGGRAVLITFTPHPKQFFHPAEHFFLHPVKIHKTILQSLGLDQILYLPFEKIYQLSPKAFFENVIMPLHPAAIVLGDNFTFGANKSGDIDCLRSLAATHDVALHALPRATFDNLPISSTRIRSAIQSGNILNANQMLTQPYTLYGNVKKGAQRGRTLGFATANIYPDDQVMPKLGAYATNIQIADEPDQYHAITAITQTPTFHKVQTVVESHILNFNRNIYGRPIQVKFVDFLRDEIRFPSKEALVQQLNQDKVLALKRLQNAPSDP